MEDKRRYVRLQYYALGFSDSLLAIFLAMAGYKERGDYSAKRQLLIVIVLYTTPNQGTAR